MSKEDLNLWVGDTIYLINDHYKIYSEKIITIDICEGCIHYLTKDYNDIYNEWLDDFDCDYMDAVFTSEEKAIEYINRRKKDGYL